MTQALYVALGLVAGVLGGMFGIGGGVILVPALVLLFGMNQHMAQGTSLAILLPPVGILAVMRYYQAGNVKLGIAAFICAGFIVGGFIGASLIQNMPSALLKKMFGVFFLLVSLHMIFSK